MKDNTKKPWKTRYMDSTDLRKETQNDFCRRLVKRKWEDLPVGKDVVIVFQHDFKVDAYCADRDGIQYCASVYRERKQAYVLGSIAKDHYIEESYDDRRITEPYFTKIIEE